MLLTCRKLKYTILPFLWMTRVVVTGNNFQGFGGNGQEEKFCPPYRCPKGQEPVPKWPLSLKSTGCSFGGGMMAIGAGAEDEAYVGCCDLRHACMMTCGTIKSHCTEQFLKCAERTCAALGEGKAKEKCDQSLSIQKMMMGMDQSCAKFDADQYSHCECVNSEKATEKRERILRNFYKKYSPDGVDKVPGLMKKVDNSQKMAGLLLKLCGKFPKAIQKVKDKQQEMYEKLIKESKDKGKDKDDNEGTEEDSEMEDLGVDEL